MEEAEMSDCNLVAFKSVEKIESLYLALEKLEMSSDADSTDTEVLRSRIDEQSALINILKHRSDELLLRCQALQKINSDLEDKVTYHHEELEKERKRYEILTERFMILAAQTDAIIVFKDEYKSENEELREKNQELRSENESLFSRKLQDKETTVQNLTLELNQLKDKYAQNEHDYRELQDSRPNFSSKHCDYEKKEASLTEKLKTLEEMQRNTAAMCDDLKKQLKSTKEEFMSNETNMTETIAALRKEKDKFLQVSLERGKVVQKKQEELEQLEIKVREEKQLRTKAEERFKRESQLVNADARVKSLQSARDENTTKYEKLKKDFEAFKEHSTNLLTYERELNKKLLLMTG
ncbi:coiled-coil domain-containing protein 89 [Boleophthalmus pectinirostris]|uniref:coiled-coil domain-containing protein 89 n=1 Tax=Boleophthalmus pectinirostris TaxID=150288 RepID=UPI00242F486B|nr:coiled-coil domain-containing protein 89 [Boleophthalmus pectinirostris]